MKLSPLGTLVVTLGALAGILIWVVALIGLPNVNTHRNLSANPAIATSAGGGNATTGTAPAGTSSGTPGKVSTDSSGAPTQLVQLPQKDASQIKLVSTDMPGYQIFEQTCAACHGQSAEGGVGPAIYAIGKYWNAQEIQAFVTEGRGMMPPKGGLSSDAQVQQVVQWLAKQTG